jgi:hypothetical protein
MKTLRMEQLGMIPYFGEQDFQLKRLEMMKADGFDSWSAKEKATFFKVERRLIERLIRKTDRYRQREAFIALLKARYANFLAHLSVEEEAVERFDILVHLTTIAEYEEGRGQGEKYFEKALDCVRNIEVADQREIISDLLDFFKRKPDKFLRLHQKIMDAWDRQLVLALSQGLADAFAAKGLIGREDVKNEFIRTVAWLKDQGEAAILMQLVSHLVEASATKGTDEKIRNFYLQLAFDAATAVEEPCTILEAGLALALGQDCADHQNGDLKFLQAALAATDAYGDVLGQEGCHLRRALSQVEDAARQE